MTSRVYNGVAYETEEEAAAARKLLLVGEFLKNRQQAYRNVFNAHTPAGFTVMQDLARFCRANQSTFELDGRAHALIEGRREVWLRIQEHTLLTDRDLVLLYSRGERK